MPLFEYKCTMCGHVTEVLEKEQQGDAMCEVCAYMALPVSSSPAGFILLGAGFHKPDKDSEVKRLVAEFEQKGTMTV